MITLVWLLLLLCLGPIVLSWYTSNRFSYSLSPILLSNLTMVRTIIPCFFVVYLTGEYPLLQIPIIATLATIAINTGYITTQTFNGAKGDIQNLNKKKINIKSENRLFWSIVFLTFLFTGLGISYYNGPPPIARAIVSIFLEGYGSDEILAMSGNRRELTKGHIFAGAAYKGQGLFKVLLFVGWSLLTCVSYASWMVAKKKKFLFTLLFAGSLGFLFILADGSRAPILRLSLCLIVLHSLIVRVRFRTLAGLSVGLFAFLFLISSLSPKIGQYANQDNFLEKSIEKLYRRIVFDNPINDVRAINLVEQGKLEHRWGKLHLYDLTAALPGAPIGGPFAYELGVILNGSNKNAVYYTGTYVTKSFVDFSYGGVFFLFFILGIINSLWEKFSVRISATVINLSIISFITTIIGELPITSVVTMGLYLFVILFFWIGFYLTIHGVKMRPN